MEHINLFLHFCKAQNRHQHFAVSYSPNAHENRPRIHQYTVLYPYTVLSTFEINQYANIHRNNWKTSLKIDKVC